jgi:hypothetical protein
MLGYNQQKPEVPQPPAFSANQKQLANVGKAIEFPLTCMARAPLCSV